MVQVDVVEARLREMILDLVTGGGRREKVAGKDWSLTRHLRDMKKDGKAKGKAV